MSRENGLVNLIIKCPCGKSIVISFSNLATKMYKRINFSEGIEVPKLVNSPSK